MMSVPVMSDGIRSGVNWMRLNFSSSTCARVWMSSVFASPGTPMIRLLPPTNSVCSTSSMTSRWPMMRLCSSARISLAAVVHLVGERDVVGRFEVDGVCDRPRVSFAWPTGYSFAA